MTAATLRRGAVRAAAASAVRAAPAGAANVDLAGGATTLKLDPKAGKALKSLGVTVSRTGKAKAGKSGVAFPITGGRIDNATAAGTIRHTGGLRLKAGKVSVTLSDFDVKVSKSPSISVKVNGGARLCPAAGAREGQGHPDGRVHPRLQRGGPPHHARRQGAQPGVQGQGVQAEAEARHRGHRRTAQGRGADRRADRAGPGSGRGRGPDVAGRDARAGGRRRRQPGRVARLSVTGGGSSTTSWAARSIGGGIADGGRHSGAAADFPYIEGGPAHRGDQRRRPCRDPGPRPGGPKVTVDGTTITVGNVPGTLTRRGRRPQQAFGVTAFTRA